MFLALLAFVVAFLAFMKSSGVADRLRKLEDDRDDLRAKVAVQQKQIERLRATLGPETKAAPAGTSAAAAELKPVVPTPRVLNPAPPAPEPKVEPRPPAKPTIILPAYEPPAPPIDWESLLGVKGAAWVGGIALITSAIFFARWTVEQGLVTPAFRFGMMLFAGIAALVAAEVGLRRGYERTANPLSGAGIAILYIAFFAGHSRYGLISMPMAFAGMVVVTITACILAVRYDAFSTAVLGLLGGFATPVALSTGEDRPIGLFSYILLLNIGLLSIGVRKRWQGLFELGLAGTFLIQLAWFSKFMSSGNMLVAIVVFGASCRASTPKISVAFPRPPEASSLRCLPAIYRFRRSPRPLKPWRTNKPQASSRSGRRNDFRFRLACPCSLSCLPCLDPFSWKAFATSEPVFS